MWWAGDLHLVSGQPDSCEPARTQLVMHLVAAIAECVAQSNRMESARAVQAHSFLRVQQVRLLENVEVVHGQTVEREIFLGACSSWR